MSSSLMRNLCDRYSCMSLMVLILLKQPVYASIRFSGAFGDGMLPVGLSFKNNHKKKTKTTLKLAPFIKEYPFQESLKHCCSAILRSEACCFRKHI